MKIQALLDKAAEVPPNDEQVDFVIDKIVEYVELFGTWYDENQELLKSEEAMEQKEGLLELLEVHESLMARASALMQSTSMELVNFRQKSKGIMAYVDVLPKRISGRKARKG